MPVKKSIRKRAFFLITAAIIAVTFTVCTVISVYFSRTLLERIESDQEFITDQTAQSLNTVLASLKETVYYLCCDQSVLSILTGSGPDSRLQSAQRNALMRTFYVYTGAPTDPILLDTRAVLLVDPQFPIVGTLNPSFSLSGINRSYLYNAANVQDADWYRETVARDSQLYSFTDPENEGYLFFSNLQNNIYITDPRYSDNVGVTLFAVPMSRITKILADARVTQGTVAAFLYGDIVLSSTDIGIFPIGEALRPEYQPLASLPNRRENTACTFEKASYAVTSRTLSGDWSIVIMVPGFDLTRSITDLIPLFTFFVLLTIGAGITVSGLLSRRLTRPILTLSQVMLRVESQDHLVAIGPFEDTQDEIALLYSSYNRMSDRIQTLTQQANRERELKRTAELRALQAQINPHFIYNTLDSVNCIALLTGQDDISVMVTSLIDILKYSIQLSRTIVTLGEELAFLDRYIAIQRLRFTDKFIFTVEIPEELHGASIPQITLQPLVENALFHAVNKSGKLEIRLSCQRIGDTLKLHVADNGSDADADRLNRILEDPADSERYGIGIRNVDKRIRLNMGDAYGLHCESLEGGGLDVVVAIPFCMI